MIYSLGEKARIVNKREKSNPDYRNQLAECKKMAFLYGNLGKKTLVRTMQRAQKKGGDVDGNFLSLLEARLDVVLKRTFFFSTILAARQWIECGKIWVNNSPKTVSSYLLQPGDLISIKPAARKLWKEQWLQNSTTLFPRPRFPFSPDLMRRWKRWSELWSNSPTPGPDFSQHRFFSKEWNRFVKDSFLSHSALSSYFPGHSGKKKRFYAFLLLKPETVVTSWLNQPFHSRAQISSREWSLGDRSTGCQGLLEQQYQVIDGLYPLRWNKLFAEKNRLVKRHWRWSEMKPLHLECSYKHCTAFFLYPPQKLAWPASINLSFLKRALAP